MVDIVDEAIGDVTQAMERAGWVAIGYCFKETMSATFSNWDYKKPKVTFTLTLLVQWNSCSQITRIQMDYNLRTA